ncbi:hypothetical protein [Hoeflea olei]|uniref:hypothetical protein n=1 Tax=Hoeflea olei TaxID=1480615 RepID=UPI001495B5C9|nr:hypothetical protein [Hoeflea olei]
MPHRLADRDPLLVASRKLWPEAAAILGWRWETLAGERPVNPFWGSPTDPELDACTRSLLRFGRVSFLSGQAEPFRAAGHRLLEVGSRPDLVGRMRKLLLRERLWLVSSEHEAAMREAYAAYGRWDFGQQPMLVMDRASTADLLEAEFLLGLLAHDRQRLEARPCGAIAWVAPLVDGVGILIASLRREHETCFARNFMAANG